MWDFEVIDTFGNSHMVAADTMEDSNGSVKFYSVCPVHGKELLRTFYAPVSAGIAPTADNLLTALVAGSL